MSKRRLLTDVKTSYQFFSWPSVSFTHLKFGTALHVRKLLNCRGEFLSLTPSRLGFSNQYGPQTAAACDVRHAKRRVLFAEQRRYIKEQQVHACVELLAAHLLPVWPCRFHPPLPLLHPSPGVINFKTLLLLSVVLPAVQAAWRCCTLGAVVVSFLTTQPCHRYPSRHCRCDHCRSCRQSPPPPLLSFSGYVCISGSMFCLIASLRDLWQD